MSLDRRRRLVQIAEQREILVLEDNPYGLLRYEGEALPPLYALDGGEYVIYLGTFSKILSAGLRLGWTAAPRPVLEKLNLGKQGADLCSSPFAQYFVIEYFAQRDWRDMLAVLREHYRRRRDTLLDALAEHFPRRGRLDPAGRRPVHLGDAARLHRHDRPAGARAARARGVRPRPRRVPRRPRRLVDAAELLRRRRGRPARGRAAHRQGRQRAGPALLDADRRRARAAAASARSPRPSRRRRPERPRAAAAAPGRRRAMSRVAVLAGGQSLERQVSLRSGGRVRDALERLGHDVIAIDVGPDLVERLEAARPDVAFVALHGRDGEDGTVQEILELVGVPYTASGPSACMRCMDKVLAKHAFRDAGLPDARLLRVQPDRVRVARRRARAAGDRGAARLPGRRQAGGAGLRARHPLRAHRRRGARRDRRRLLLRHEGPARAPRRRPRARGLGARRTRRARRRCRSSRRSRAAATATTSRPATRSGAPTSSARRTSTPRSRRARRRSRSRPTGSSAATGSRAST